MLRTLSCSHSALGVLSAIWIEAGKLIAGHEHKTMMNLPENGYTVTILFLSHYYCPFSTAA